MWNDEDKINFWAPFILIGVQVVFLVGCFILICMII